MGLGRSAKSRAKIELYSDMAGQVQAIAKARIGVSGVLAHPVLAVWRVERAVSGVSLAPSF